MSSPHHTTGQRPVRAHRETAGWRCRNEQMRAVRYDHAFDHYLVDLPDPEPAPGEVRLAVRCTGVCGTDVHLHEGEFGPVYPLTPGHEVIGEVVALGDGVSTLTTGNVVAVDNMVPCGG